MLISTNQEKLSGIALGCSLEGVRPIMIESHSNIFASERRETIVDTPSLYSYRLATPKWPFISLSLSVRLNNFNNLDKIKTEKGSEF